MATKTKQLPFSDKDLAFWRTEVKQSRQKRTDVSEADGWDDNLTRYKPPQKAAGRSNGDVNTGADFRDVERKKAALLFEFPAIGLGVKKDRQVAPATPDMPQPLMLSTLVNWQSDLLNTILDQEHANAEHAARKALFACLCPSGIGPVTVGYKVTMRTVKQMTPVLDPLTGIPVMKPVPAMEQVGAALGMIAPMPEPLLVEKDVEVPIHEHWFVSDSSPKALLIPASFKDTLYRRAPWLGKDWRKPTSQVIREHGLPVGWKATADSDQEKTHFEHGANAESHEDDAGDPYVTGVELYYRKYFRSTEEVHPDALVKLVMVDGHDTPLVHEDWQCQSFTDTGEMTLDSVRDFPDIPLVLRDLTDSAYVPSDCAVTAQLTKEGEKYRTQIIVNREGNKQVIAVAASVDPTALDKIKSANGVTWVVVPDEVMSRGIDSVMKQVATPTLGREQYVGMDVIERDREQILGIGSNQSGIQNKSKRTATEVDNVQRNSEARFEQERKRVNAWVLSIARAMDALILRYCDERVAVEILGDVRGKLWAQYKHALVGGYRYSLKVDSGKYMDVEADRRQALQAYGTLRKDPFVNPKVLLQNVAEKLGYDPAEFIVQPQKPDKEMKASISFKATEDFNPANPAFSINVKLARQAGWDITEEDIRLAQQAVQAQSGGMMPVSGVGPNPGKEPAITLDHPGMQEKADTINQHVVDQSGARSGPKTAVN